MPSTSMSGPSIAEEEANSTLSNDDGSSGDESRMTSAGPNKKRRREKHQKISYVPSVAIGELRLNGVIAARCARRAR